MSAWRDQKLAALNGEYNYGYIVGPGYDTIPKEVYQNGFVSVDHARNEVQFGATNVPLDVANLYAGHANVGNSSLSGYHAYNTAEVAIDLAPLNPNFPRLLANRLQTFVDIAPQASDTSNTLIGVVPIDIALPNAGLSPAGQMGPFANRSPPTSKFSEPQHKYFDKSGNECAIL